MNFGNNQRNSNKADIAQGTQKNDIKQCCSVIQSDAFKIWKSDFWLNCDFKKPYINSIKIFKKVTCREPNLLSL